MRKRRFYTLLAVILAFVAGYFNPIIAPYFVNTEFCLGVSFALLVFVFAYALHLKEQVKELRREIYDRGSDILDTLQLIHKKLNENEQ